MDKFKTKGVLRGVKIDEGTKQDGSKWRKATLTIDKDDGNKVVLGTFDSKMIDLANKVNGKEVQAIYVKNGKYNNLDKSDNALSVVGDGDAPEVQEETIVDEDEVVEEKPTPKKDMKTVADYNNRKKQEDDRRQSLIVRQNSWTQALKLIENTLKAIDMQFIKSEEFSKEELNFEKVSTSQ